MEKNKETLKKNTLAIVIANYEGLKDTVACLDSINKSTIKDFFVVLVDDCSTTDAITEDFIKECEEKYFFDIVGVMLEENLGFAGANNAGINKAMEYDPSYIMLLNNDTLISEDALEILISRMNISSMTVLAPKILCMDDDSVIWSAGGMMDEELKIAKNIGYLQSDDGSYDQENMCFFVSFCCAVIPVEAFRSEVGMLSEDYYMYGEDVDYSIRLRQAGYKLLYIPEVSILHKGGATGVSSGSHSLYYSVRNECIIREKYMDGGSAFNEKLLAKQKQKCAIKKMAHRDISGNLKMIEGIEAWKRGERGRHV